MQKPSSKTKPAYKRNPAKYVPTNVLGTASDPVLAKRYGVSESHVYNLRVDNGVAAFFKHEKPKSRIAPWHDLAMSGEKGSAVRVASLAGVSRQAVHEYRKTWKGRKSDGTTNTNDLASGKSTD